MRRDSIDFHEVRPQHIKVHESLLNWARYVDGGRRQSWGIQPMFKHYRSTDVWVDLTPQIPIDRLAGSAMEKAVSFLPESHKLAIRWSYVYSRWVPVFRVCRALGVRQDTLNELVHDGRSMLKNRGN